MTQNELLRDLTDKVYEALLKATDSKEGDGLETSFRSARLLIDINDGGHTMLAASTIAKAFMDRGYNHWPSKSVRAFKQADRAIPTQVTYWVVCFD